MAGRTHITSRKSEARFIAVCLEREWEIAKPLWHEQPFDFVMRHAGIWKTVQVKTAYNGQSGNRKSARQVSIRRANERGSRPYKTGDFDLLFVVDGSACYLIPWDAIKERTSSISVSGGKYDKWLLP